MKIKAVFVLAAACFGGLLSQNALALDDAYFRFENTSDLYEICIVEADAPEY